MILQMLDDAIKGQAGDRFKTKVAVDKQAWQDSNKKEVSVQMCHESYQKKKKIN
jgi:hypothetical protein